MSTEDEKVTFITIRDKKLKNGTSTYLDIEMIVVGAIGITNDLSSYIIDAVVSEIGLRRQFHSKANRRF